MSRENWMKLRGLHESENPVFLDYDSLALHAAHRLGNREVILRDDCCVYKLDHNRTTIARSHQVWTPGWRRLEEWASLGGETFTNCVRMVFNYPKREDASFEGVLLDSFERHFLLPAQLWAHGFPIVRQNFGDWGLGHETLSEHQLAVGDWEKTSCDKAKKAGRGPEDHHGRPVSTEET
jgi:hypothetical protein